MSNRFKSTKEYPEPESIRECDDRMEMLFREIEDIKVQLGLQEKTDAAGRVLSPDEHQAWKERARTSLAYKEAERYFLKRWRRNYLYAVQAEEAGIFDPSDPRYYVMNFVKLTRSYIRAEMNDRDEEADELFDELRRLTSTAQTYLQEDGQWKKSA